MDATIKLAYVQAVEQAIVTVIQKSIIAGALRRGDDGDDLALVVIPRFMLNLNNLRRTNMLLDFIHEHPIFPSQYGDIQFSVSPLAAYVGDDKTPVRIHLAGASNLGVVTFLATGPRCFTKWISRNLPHPLSLENGRLYHDGRALFVPDEESFFAQLGLEYISLHTRRDFCHNKDRYAALFHWRMNHASSP